MGKLIVEQIVSADGYAEDAEGGIGFFVNAKGVNEVDTEQLRMLSGVEAIVFGAKTYRLFADYWPSADPAAEPVATPIMNLPKFVISSTLPSAPWGADDSAEVLRGDAVAAVRGLRHRYTGNLIVWGSLSLSQALLRAGEVDVLRLRMLPLLLGSGRSFAPADLGLRTMALLTVQTLPGGLLVLEYNITR
jgi:dihydrofolate reductase